MNFRYIPVTLSILLLSVTSWAQTKPEEKKPEPKKGSIEEEIDIVRPYKPVLADAAKIRRSPDLTNYKPFQPKLTYAILDKRLELNSDIRQLQAQPVIESLRAPLKNNYAKLGFGNYSGNLGEVYINTGEDEALQAGFFFRHLAQSGNIERQKFSRQDIGVFGKSIQEKVTFQGELGYDRLATYFYAFNPALPLINLAPDKQRLGTISLKGEILKNFEKDKALDYAAKGDLYTFRNKYDAKESSFALSGFVNNVWKQFNIGLNTSADFTWAKDSLDFGNHIFKANPYIKFQGKNYKISLGVNLVQEFGTETHTNLLPAITAELPIVPQYATIFGGFTGDIRKSSLRDFSYENPYIGRISIQNSLEKSNIYGGIKGNGGSGFGFRGMVFYKRINSMPLYVNNTSTPDRFNILYDDSKVFGIEGELSVKASETLNWTGKVEMTNYKMDTQKEAWMKPGFRLYSDARLAIKKKFIIDGEIVLNGDAQALTFTPDPTIVTIKSYADLSAGAEYVVKDKLGVFLRVNNIFASQYQQFLYYPKLGFNMLGGLNYSF